MKRGRQGDLFVKIVPTRALRAGEDFVTQCAQCGLLVCAPVKPVATLGSCPACAGSTWWAQKLPVGPFREGQRRARRKT